MVSSCRGIFVLNTVFMWGLHLNVELGVVRRDWGEDRPLLRIAHRVVFVRFGGAVACG